MRSPVRPTRRVPSCLIAASGRACAGTAASAARTYMRPLAAIKQDGTLRVGLTGDYAPYSLRLPDGSIKGTAASAARTYMAPTNLRIVTALTFCVVVNCSVVRSGR
jgi:ABC-type amino acid transport substrate-binding protein